MSAMTTVAIDEDMLKECNDIIGKLEKSMLSTKIGMVQEILVRNVQLMKDIENYQTQLDQATTTTDKTEEVGDNNEDNDRERVDGTTGKEGDIVLISGYVDSVHELNGNLSQVRTHKSCVLRSISFESSHF